MIPLTHLRDTRVGVFGLGTAGRAGVAALAGGGAHVYAWDDNETSRNTSTPAALAPPEDWPWASLSCVLLSPGIPLTHPEPHPVVTLAQQYRVPIVGEAELLWRDHPDATYVGITGTNGKSTTTALIGHILREAGVREQTGGNLGVPALALEPLGKAGVYVLELSSYQLDLMQNARINIAVFLNITPDHLDRHGSMKNYIAAKKRIFQNQKAGDTAIIGVDGEVERTIVAELSSSPPEGRRVIPIAGTHALEHGVYALDGELTSTGFGHTETLSLTGIPSLRGAHNGQNAAAAFAVCRALGLTGAQIKAGMRTFPGLPHRMEQVAVLNEIPYVNDSKATNCEAAARALASFENIYWIAGGRAKSDSPEVLTPFFPRIRHAFLIGEAQDRFAGALEGYVETTRCGTLERAVAEAHRMAQGDRAPQATVLLSPACASFDQFANFEARGTHFKELVIDRIKNRE